MRITGKYAISTTLGEPVKAYVPNILPPHDLQIDAARATKLSDALQALQKLTIATSLVASQEWLIYGFVRKEAVVTSQIEGTQATLIDLLNHEDEKEQTADLEEVCNYLAAINYAWGEMTKAKGLPLSLRLIKESHKRLMKGVRGQDKTPGEFRNSQNWIGGVRPSDATFVPPPPQEMRACLEELEKYFHEEDDIHPLIRTAMIHVQFETIHPFLDGNGRIGRLLIVLLLQKYDLLKSPLLYLSLYFKKHRGEYYTLLNRVRTHGEWEAWIDFFLDAIKTVAEDVIETSTRLYQVTLRHRELILKHPKTTVAALRLFEALPNKPIIDLADAVKRLELTKPTVSKAIKILIDLGILIETSGKMRDRSYRYHDYLEILAEGTEL
ncbi:MAG: Fic family protein [Chitinophagaceae bacterium]|nr:Fic family protein [Oligoflexus sp.]